MKKYLTIIAIAIVSVGVIALALQSRKDSANPIMGAPTTTIPVSVQVLSAEEAKNSLSDRSFPATITSEGEAKIFAEVSGTVLSDTVSLGSPVNVGQTLYHIDTRGGTTSPETGFESTSVLQAKLALKNAEESYEQAKRDYEKNKSSALKTARDIQKNIRDSARAQYAAVLDKQTLKSPIRGVVTSESVAIGDTVTPGTPLAVISAGKKIARFFVSYDDLSLLSPKQSVTLTTENSNNSIQGFISRISPIADSASKRFLVEVGSTDPKFQKIPSETIATTNINLTRTAQENAVLIPLSALLQEQNGSFVFIVDGTNARRLEVKTDAIYGETVEISGDIKSETQFIITNAKRLTDGAEITVD